MKEIEELFRKLRHHYRLFLKGSNDSFIKMNEIETALISKFRELENALCMQGAQLESIIDYAEKGIEPSDFMTSFGEVSSVINFIKDLKQRAEQAEEQVERLKDIGVERDNALVAYDNLKCCGNCRNRCLKSCINYDIKSNSWPIASFYCDNWQLDGLKRSER